MSSLKVQFQAFGMMHRMSLTDFCIQLGLYDAEFTRTPTYDALQISRLGGESLEDAWRQLSTNPTYDPCRTKATTLRSPTLKYIHFILSHTLTRRNDSIGVISCGDFNFLLNMIDGFYHIWGMRSQYLSCTRGPILASEPSLSALILLI